MRFFLSGLAAILMSLYCSAGLAQRECDARQILQPGQCDGDENDDSEHQLAQLINAYRMENGLPAIAMSPALSLVGNRHVRDMTLNLKKLSHDWSNCPMSRSKDCMWEAPRALGTRYPGAGYENAYVTYATSGASKSVATILESWKEGGNGPHNNLILNRGNFKGKQWQALGIGIYQSYAVMWVGEEVDPSASAATLPTPRSAQTGFSVASLLGLWQSTGNADESLEIMNSRGGGYIFRSEEGNPIVSYYGKVAAEGDTLVLTYSDSVAAGWSCRMNTQYRTRDRKPQEILAGICTAPNEESVTLEFVRK